MGLRLGFFYVVVYGLFWWFHLMGEVRVEV